MTGHDSSRVSPFGHPRITARLPTPRGLSQAPTSFIGSWCQGIHHVPLNACQTQTLNKHNTHPEPPNKQGKAHTRANPGTHHTRQAHTTKNNNPHRTKPTRTTPPNKPCGRPKKASCASRCSRPLSTSQTPRNQPAHPTNPQTQHTDPQATSREASPDVSGPNSVPNPPTTRHLPRSTPTRGTQAPPKENPRTTRRAVLDVSAPPHGAFIDDSTNETPPDAAHTQPQKTQDHRWTCRARAP